MSIVPDLDRSGKCAGCGRDGVIRVRRLTVAESEMGRFHLCDECAVDLARLLLGCQNPGLSPAPVWLPLGDCEREAAAVALGRALARVLDVGRVGFQGNPPESFLGRARAGL